MSEDVEAEQRRYEEERRERIRRRNRISGRLVIWIMVAALALLSYDSAAAALTAHRDDRPSGYPAALSVICACAAIAVCAWSFARRRR